LAVARLRGWNRGITSTRCVRLALTLTTYRCAHSPPPGHRCREKPFRQSAVRGGWGGGEWAHTSFSPKKDIILLKNNPMVGYRPRRGAWGLRAIRPAVCGCATEWSVHVLLPLRCCEPCEERASSSTGWLLERYLRGW
jgi:hypothetical protein